MYSKFKNVFMLSALCLFFCNAIAATYPLPAEGNDIVGENYYVKAERGETLASVGLRYGMSYHEMMEANPNINSTAVISGRKVLIPAQFILPSYRKGIVVNLTELRLYYFPGNGTVLTFPVAMGRDQWRTPAVSTTVTWKEKDPTWNVPESIRIYTLEAGNKLLPKTVPPGPDNPLGHYALHLGAEGYLIHGNNAPNTIGKYVSSGCIRMKNADIETLFNDVKVGTPVRIIHYPTKVGWNNGVLYQESQIPVDISDSPSDLNVMSLREAVERGVGIKNAYIDWNEVNKVAKKHLGIPEPIGEAAPGTHNAYTTTESSPEKLSFNKDSASMSPSNVYAVENKISENQNEIFSESDDHHVTIQINDDKGVSP